MPADVAWFLLWMLPWLGLALAILYAGYAAWDASRKRERLAATPPGPDPLIELQKINTDLARVATHSRQSLERTRDTMRSGLKG